MSPERAETRTAIMAVHHGVDTHIDLPLAVRIGTRRLGPPASPLALPARPRADLLLGVSLARFPDPRADWAARNPPRWRIPADPCGDLRPGGLLVCADAAVVFKQLAGADGNLLARHGCLAAPGLEFLAARDVAGLFCVFPLLRQRRAGVLRLPV